jgi:hypothetical protein
VALQKQMKKDDNTLDNAADVIHGDWESPEKPHAEKPTSQKDLALHLPS